MEQKLQEFYGHPKYLEIINELIELHNKKNKQYADKKDPLGNFDRCSKIMSRGYSEIIKNDPYRTMSFYATNLANKQWDGAIEIMAYDKTDTPDSLEEKLMDLAN